MTNQSDTPWFNFALDLCTPEPELVEDEKQIIREIENMEFSEYAY